MRIKQFVALALAIVMVATVFVPVASAAGSDQGIDLSATVLEPKPQIGIEISESTVNFGELLPGQTSEPSSLTVTNVGVENIDVTATVSDNGTEPLFVPGLLINDADWREYSASLSADVSIDAELALHVPDDYASRGAVSGSAIFWAEEHTEPIASTSDWTKFQYDLYNSGITSGPAPRTSNGSYEFAVFTSVDSYMASGIDTPPVVVGDTLYTISAGGKVFAFDKVTGATKWQTDLGGAFILGPPTVANGKVFAGTNAGRISALDAATGKVLWTQLVGGQMNTPFIYDNGLIYCGNWGTTIGGSYMCFNEQGTRVWSFDSDGGFYWDGAAIVGDHIAFANENGYLFSLDKRTGELVDSVNCNELYGVSVGNIHSSLSYVPSTERLYFTSTGGFCHYIGFDPETGSFNKSDIAKASIGGSTSTPAVYNGRVYVGDATSLRCLDADTLGSIWTFATGVKVQSSPSISTYYDDGDGEIYIYFTTNGGSGGLFCLKDVANSTAPTFQFIFTPPSSMKQYTLQGAAISDGWVYFGNDAGWLFAINETVAPPAGEFTYTSDGSNVTITGYMGAGGDVVVPGELDGLPVTAIGNLAFSGRTAVTSVTIPNSVTSLGTNVFLGCTALTAINVDAANTVYASVDGVLYGKQSGAITTLMLCPLGKIGTVTMPDSVTTIGAAAFASCNALTSVTIGNGVTTIAINAFRYNTGLISVTIPNSVTSIGTFVFYGCTALTSVTIPSSVTTIPAATFYGCTALTSVTIPDSVTSIGDQAFQGCTALTSVAIPDSVTSIGASAFYGCTALTSVTIPSSVTTIGGSAFYGCTALTAINVDEANTAYKSVDGIVYNKAGTTLVLCPGGRTSFTIPDSVTSIGASAFASCSVLTSVTIPSSVTSIGSNAFQGCTALTSITIPSSVNSIGTSAFASCSVLTSVTIPNSVTSIANNVFQNCVALTSVTIPSSVTSIGTSAFQGCTALTSITIPNSVTSIGNQPFYGCTALTAVVFEGNAPTSMASNWASGATNLVAYYTATATGFTTPTWNSVPCYPIGAPTAAFASNVVSGTAPLAVTFAYNGVGANSFAWDFNNDGIVDSMARNPAYTYTAPGTYTVKLTVSNPWGTDDEVKDDYITATSVRTDGLVYTSDGSKVTVTGYAGAGGDVAIPGTIDGMPVVAIATNAFNGKAALTSVTIPNSVTSIGNAAFSGCSALTSVTISDSVTSIGSQAFNQCAHLTSVTIPNSVTSIGTQAFASCTALTAVNIGSKVTTIASAMFTGDTALTAINVDEANTAYKSVDGIVYNKAGTTLVLCPAGKAGSVTIPSSVTSIGASAFASCTALTSVTIPSSVTSIGTRAFSDCIALTSVSIGSGVTSIGTNMFSGCTALTSITIPNSVNSIGTSAFNGCTGLISVSVGSGVTSIGVSAFAGCTALTSMVFNGNAPTVGSNWANGDTNLVVYYTATATGFTTPTWNNVASYPIGAPTAAFSADVTSGTAPLTVHFADRSTGLVLDRAWDFDGDGIVDSHEQNPVWTYPAVGTNTVKLTVSNQVGSGTETKTGYIVAVLPSSVWELFHGDQQLSGHYDGDVVDTASLKWISAAIDAQPSSSVVIAQGKVFVYCYNGTEKKGYIAALDQSNGSLVWKKQTVVSNVHGSWATPAYHDGLIFTSGDVARYASNGEPAWTDGRYLPDDTNGGPMIAEGKVFIGNWDGSKYLAFDEKTGQQVWEFSVTGTAQGTPSYHDGKLFLTSWISPGGNIYCLYANNGTIVWHATTALDTCGSPMVAAGYVYVTTYNFDGKGDIFCFYESNGTQVWTQKIQRTDSTPAYYDGKVYVTGGCYGYSPHQTYCFDAVTGALIWSTTTDQDIGGWTTSVVIADGKVFVGREGAWSGGMRFGYVKLFALDANTGTEMWSYDGCGATVAIADGAVYSAGIDGRIYAFGPAA